MIPEMDNTHKENAMQKWEYLTISNNMDEKGQRDFILIVNDQQVSFKKWDFFFNLKQKIKMDGNCTHKHTPKQDLLTS
jgi:hypothetical protein